MLTLSEVQGAAATYHTEKLPQPGEMWVQLDGEIVTVEKIDLRNSIGPMQVKQANGSITNRTRDGRHTIMGGRDADPKNLISKHLEGANHDTDTRR